MQELQETTIHKDQNGNPYRLSNKNDSIIPYFL